MQKTKKKKEEKVFVSYLIVIHAKLISFWTDVNNKN